MKNTHIFSSLFLILSLNASFLCAQELKAYQIYNKNKEKVDFNTMINALQNYDIVLFGEFHDSSIIHWLELKTAEALYKKTKNLNLGAEMFEADNQIIMDEFLEDKISRDNFESEMRLWDNYKTDYRPLVNFVRKHRLKFIATNIPRRYASYVYKNGLDSLHTLSSQAQQFIAPMPLKIDTLAPGYGNMLSIIKEHGLKKTRAKNFIASQAIKDATMAHFISKNLPQNGIFLHYNGNYHSKDYGGIYWYLKQQHPELNIAVITVSEDEQENLLIPEDHLKLTEFNIVIASDFTKTY